MQEAAATTEAKDADPRLYSPEAQAALEAYSVKDASKSSLLLLNWLP